MGLGFKDYQYEIVYGESKVTTMTNDITWH